MVLKCKLEYKLNDSLMLNEIFIINNKKKLKKHISNIYSTVNEKVIFVRQLL